MIKKPYIYLGTPYCFRTKSKEIGVNKPDFSETDKKVRIERFEKVSEVAAKLFNAGFWVFSPISMTHPIAQYMEDAGVFSSWEKFDYFMLSQCDMMFALCIDGWELSDGLQKEITFARQNGIPVIYIDEHLTIREV
jgi:nucleoside 2-deoxyribosyltransferase